MLTMLTKTHTSMGWSYNFYDKDEKPFTCNQVSYSGNSSEYLPKDEFWDFFSLMECDCPHHLLYESLSIEPSEPIPSLKDYDVFYDLKNVFDGWIEIIDEKKEVVEVKQEGNDRNTKHLSKKTISQYFYMPITQAARELNVGLTHLKKRCRELGIRRWPHRKLMSLQTLINNIQELGKEEGPLSDEKLRDIEKLEKEKKQVEEMPDIELEVHTKRLRQHCFKANYKKRKLMDQQMF